MFERIDVLGATDYTFTLTAHAMSRGWDAAFGAGVVRVKGGQSGRGERTWPRGTYLIASGSTEGLRLPSADEAQEGGVRVVGVGGGSPNPIAHVGKGPHLAQ